MSVLTDHTKSIQEVSNDIQLDANNKKSSDIRFVKTILQGQVVRQGDIYIHCVSQDFTKGRLSESRKLAMGDTQGSRHIAEAPAQVFQGIDLPTYMLNQYRGSKLKLLNAVGGPFIESEARFIISHPEHSNVSLPMGCYQISHQLDPRTATRVKD